MAGHERIPVEQLLQLTPNERAEHARAGIVREWESLDASEQARIQATAADLRRRLSDAQA